MFVGHYSVSFAARRASNDVPLWIWFIAVQWLDLFFMVFVLAGIEKLRLTPGFTEANPLDLYFMPYSHGLIGATVLSVLFAALVGALLPAARRPGTLALLAVASFSHWILDLLVHTPDLALFGTEGEVGFGLWNHLAIELPLEIALLGVFAWLYARTLPNASARRRVWVVAVVMLVLHAYGNFGPVPPSTSAFAVSALAAYALLIAAAWWIERPSTAAEKSVSSAA